jgi:hypothetical protein
MQKSVECGGQICHGASSKALTANLCGNCVSPCPPFHDKKMVFSGVRAESKQKNN